MMRPTIDIRFSIAICAVMSGAAFILGQYIGFPGCH